MVCQLHSKETHLNGIYLLRVPFLTSQHSCTNLQITENILNSQVFFRIEEEKIVSQEPPTVPPDPQAFTVQDVGNGGGDGLFGSDVFQEHSSNGHVGENNLGYVDVENGVAGNGFARSKRKVDAVELPTLQKRVRHAE